VKSINCTGFSEKNCSREQLRYAPLFSEYASTVEQWSMVQHFAAQEAAPSCFSFSCVSNAANRGIHEQ